MYARCASDATFGLTASFTPGTGNNAATLYELPA